LPAQPVHDRAATALLVVAALYPTLAAWLYFVTLGDHPQMRVAYGGAKVVQALLPLVGWWLLGMARGSGQPPVRRGAPTAGLLTGLLLGGGVLAAWASPLAQWQALGPVPGRVWARLVTLGADTPLRFLALAIFLSVLHSWFEEYYWRWFVFGQLERRMAGWKAMTLSSLAFASHHWIVLDSFLAGEHRWTATLPLTLLVAAAGAVWAWLYRRYRGVLAPWLSHLLVDAALMAVGYQLIW
jgi:membrane protease YdiL (CAAX protease family)